MSAPEPRGPRYWIETWGCQMNVHDSEKLAGSLEHAGWAAAPSQGDADLVLLNTCAIREKASEKVFSELGRLRVLKEERGTLLGVCGCVAQLEGQALLERAPYVDFVLGPRATGALPELLVRLRAGDESARHTLDLEQRNDGIRFPFDRIRREESGSHKAYVTVVEGCNHRCTFCVVPRTRGPEVCREMEDVLAEVRALAEAGTLEIEFLGQTVNAWRDRSGRTLGDLLLAASGIPGIRRIRFTTSHPAQMTERLMDAMAAARPALCPYLHLPVQSGSTPVLRAMRRGYDRETYLAKIDGLRRRIPGISLGTDVIVGFPGETEADFRATVSLLEEVGFDQVYAFTYSARPGTAAAGRADDVPEPEKMARLAGLLARQREIQEARNARWVGRTVEVLVDGSSRRRDRVEWAGRTPEARIVNFPGPTRPGALESVRVVAASAFALKGLLDGPAA